MEKVVLWQCVLSLEAAHDACEDTYAVIEPIFGSRFEIQQHLQLVQAKQGFRDHIKIAMPIVRLYEEVYWQEEHRKRRALQLMKVSVEKATEFCSQIEQGVRLEDESYIHARVAFERLCRARDLLQNAYRLLELCLAAEKSVDRDNEPPKRASNTTPDRTDVFIPAPFTVEEYFRPRLYDWMPTAYTILDLERPRRKQQMLEMSLNKLAVGFDRLGVTKEPLYGNNGRRDVDPYYRWEYDGINAIWLSPDFERLGFVRTESTYQMLLSVVNDKREESKQDPNNNWDHDNFGELGYFPRRKRTFQPIILAKGCRELGVDLGIIFFDEPSVVVWPLARKFQEQRRSLVILCRLQRNNEEYAAVRLLEARDVPLPNVTVPWTFDRALEKKSRGAPNGLLRTVPRYRRQSKTWQEVLSFHAASCRIAKQDLRGVSR